MNSTLLLVDDDQNTREGLALALGRGDYLVITASNGEEGKEKLDTNPVDVLITDMQMPGISGIELLQYAKLNYPDVMVIMITGHGSIETAISAMKDGAFDYIMKPIKLEEVKMTISKAVEKRSLIKENLMLKQQLKGKYTFENIVGNSPAMQEVFSMMEKVVDSDSNVLIQGESGTGKELVAKALHYNGPRKDRPFVAINCAAIPSELIESELFGHLKGSFTGAVANRVGRFELAHTGTIFLDEISSMGMLLQGKILRVIQEKEFERVGGGKTTKVDVRVISATNLELEKAVKAGIFRDDLYYRLNVIPINLPPLRGRTEDIPLLVMHFLAKFNARQNKDIKGYVNGVMRKLTAYQWPGNIRELENVVERAVTLAPGEYIDVSDLPKDIQNIDDYGSMIGPLPMTEHGLDMAREVELFESAMIRTAIEKSGGVKSKAAELLSIKRTTLVEKMKRLDIKAD